MLTAMSLLQDAVLRARQRCADSTIGTRAHQGSVQVVRVRYDTAGRSTVVPVADCMTIAEAIEVLDELEPAKP